MNKSLAGKLNLLFGEQAKWDIFIEYLEQEEEKIRKTSRTSNDTDDMLRYQGQDRFIYTLKNLRSVIKIELKGN